MILPGTTQKFNVHIYKVRLPGDTGHKEPQ